MTDFSFQDFQCVQTRLLRTGFGRNHAIIPDDIARLELPNVKITGHERPNTHARTDNHNHTHADATRNETDFASTMPGQRMD